MKSGTKIALVPLSNGMVAKIDAADLPLIAGRIWTAWKHRKTFYAVSRSLGVFEYMHKVLMPNAPQVDHRDGDGLNNVRLNLRRASDTDNRANQSRRKDSRLPFKGISFDRRSSSWRAAIQCERKRRHLGTFESAEAAARAYDEAARNHFGKFARLNFPSEGEARA